MGEGCVMHMANNCRVAKMYAFKSHTLQYVPFAQLQLCNNYCSAMVKNSLISISALRCAMQ